MRYQVEARSRQQQLFSYLALRATDIVADIGCGTGYFTGLIQHQVAYALGVDIDLQALRLAKRFYQRLDFVLGSATRLPLKDEAVTKVLCTEVLEHVADDSRVVAECFRILRDYGVLSCSTPNASFPFRSRKSSHQGPQGPEFHFRRGYSPPAFQRLLSRAGFDSIQLSYALPMLGTLLVEVLKRIYSAAYRPLRSQSELARLNASRAFKTYKLIFPILLFLINVGLPRSLGGSILVVKARRTK